MDPNVFFWYIFSVRYLECTNFCTLQRWKTGTLITITLKKKKSNKTKHCDTGVYFVLKHYTRADISRTVARFVSPPFMKLILFSKLKCECWLWAISAKVTNFSVFFSALIFLKCFKHLAWRLKSLRNKSCHSHTILYSFILLPETLTSHPAINNSYIQTQTLHHSDKHTCSF